MGMVIKNPVIVMALYDIGRDNWDNFRMSYHTYGWWMRNTLSMDAKVVVYTENKFIDDIVKYRREFDPELKNFIIVDMPLNELPIYQQYNDKLTNLMNSEEFKAKVSFHDVPEMCKPLYNVIMFNKVFFLEDAIRKEYFDNDLVIWADAGGLREDVGNYVGVKWPSPDKLKNINPNKITFFSHNKDFSVPDRQYHSLSQIRNIQGTAFLLPSHLIDELKALVLETIDESLASGFIGSDEKIFDICYVKRKELFDLIQCSWREYFDVLK